MAQQFAEAFCVFYFTGKRFIDVGFALTQITQLNFERGDLLAQVFLADSRDIGLERDLHIEQYGLRALELLGQSLALERSAAERQPDLVKLKAPGFEVGLVRVALRAAANGAVRDAQPAMLRPLPINLFDLIERGDALANVGGQALEVTQRFELILQRLHVDEILVEQVVVDEGANVGQWAEGEALDDFGDERFLELAESIEQMVTVIFEPREDLRPAATWKRKVLDVTLEGAGVEQLAGRAEEPVVVERGIVDDEVGQVGTATILVRIDHRAVDEVRAVGVSELERDDAGRVAAQEVPAFGADLAAHVAGERALAAAQRRLVEFHVALPADERELHGVEDGRFTDAVDADEIRRALARDRGVLE